MKHFAIPCKTGREYYNRNQHLCHKAPEIVRTRIKGKRETHYVGYQDHPHATPKAKPTDETKLGFGKKFSDHMFVMDYTEGEGWHDARIVPYGPFELDPATVVFHYAQEIFEA